MDLPSNFKFSENEKNYTEISIPFDVNLLNKETMNFERMEYMSDEIENNLTSFNFLFNLTGGSKELNLQNQNEAYLKYYPNNNDTLVDFINCSYEENSTSLYKIICFPKKNVFTRIKTTKIIIPQISNRRLRYLESGTNITILPPSDASGAIDFKYSAPRSNFKRPNGGLSAGAIVAIVLSTVAAVVAIGLAIIFLNRIKANPPPIRNPTDKNMANSTSNINN